GRRAAVALVLVGRLDAPLRELLGFLVGDRRLVGELARALERRELCEIPGRLQVRMAVGGARHGRLLRLRGERDGQQQEDAEREGTHGAAPFELGRKDRNGRKEQQLLSLRPSRAYKSTPES